MHTALACFPALIIKSLPGTAPRLLLFGETGIGKSTLAQGLARQLAAEGLCCFCISADPGSPAFGVPGAISLAKWHQDSWQVIGLEALCSLDAVRFRLPLISAVGRLASKISNELLLVDAPGVVRSVAGAELLTALVETAAIDTILVLARDPQRLPLANELTALGVKVLVVQALPEARRPSAHTRAAHRTRLWDDYLHRAELKSISIFSSQLVGTPPALPVDRNWQGRQIAYLRAGQTMALGEIMGGTGEVLQLKIGATQGLPEHVLVRDAYRNQQGRLATLRPAKESGLYYLPPPDVSPYPGLARSGAGPIPMARLGEVTAILVNGAFGDPLLHVRLHLRKRSILFDLGEGNRLPARLAHQVTDVFISHAHIDHISGFLWLLRSRIGMQTPCRLFGPRGLAENIAGLIGGILWDRIGEGGPRFEVAEFDQNRQVIYGLRAGSRSRQKLAERTVEGGMLLDEPGFKVWAVPLKHKAIPVMAYALELGPKLNVEQQQLVSRGLTPGPWLAELKKHMTAGNSEAKIILPDRETGLAGELGAELIRITPAQKLVYATDLAATAENRRKLIALATSAKIFFCEAAFIEADRRHAEASGHLTARACGEIAQAARVEQLVPFHFSRRYEHNPLEIYEEVKAACRRVLLPIHLLD